MAGFGPKSPPAFAASAQTGTTGPRSGSRSRAASGRAALATFPASAALPSAALATAAATSRRLPLSRGRCRRLTLSSGALRQDGRIQARDGERRCADEHEPNLPEPRMSRRHRHAFTLLTDMERHAERPRSIQNASRLCAHRSGCNCAGCGQVAGSGRAEARPSE